METKKVLVIRFSSIGDIILCSPIVRALSEQLGHEVHFCTKENYAGLLSSNPHITKVHTLEENKLDVLIQSLKKEGFDYVIDLHKKYRSKRIVKRLGLPSYSFYKENLEKWLMVDFKIDRLSGKHLVERYYEGLTELGIYDDRLGLDYYIHPDTRLPEADYDDLYIVLAIGGSYETKRLPFKQLVRLCDLLDSYQVILVGGKENYDESLQIMEESTHPNLINLVAESSLDQTALLISRCETLVTHDTATMHMGAAFNKPIVSVWGNTIPKFGMFPYQNRAEEESLIVENNDLHCRPCSKLGYKSCPKGHFRCMSDLSMNLISNHIDNIVKQLSTYGSK